MTDFKALVGKLKNTLDAKTQELEDQVSFHQNELKELEKTLTTAHQSQVEGLLENIHKVESERDKLQAELRNTVSIAVYTELFNTHKDYKYTTTSEIQNLRYSKAHLESSIATLQNSIVEHKTQIKARDEAIDNLSQTLSTRQGELAREQSKHLRQVAELNNKILKNVPVLESEKVKVQNLLSIIKDVEAKCSSLEQELLSYKEKDTEWKHKSLAFSRLVKAHKQLQHQLAVKNDKNRQMLEEFGMLQATSAFQQNTLQCHQSQVAKYEKELKQIEQHHRETLAATSQEYEAKLSLFKKTTSYYIDTVVADVEKRLIQERTLYQDKCAELRTNYEKQLVERDYTTQRLQQKTIGTVEEKHKSLYAKMLEERKQTTDLIALLKIQALADKEGFEKNLKELHLQLNTCQLECGKQRASCSQITNEFKTKEAQYLTDLKALQTQCSGMKTTVSSSVAKADTVSKELEKLQEAYTRQSLLLDQANREVIALDTKITSMETAYHEQISLLKGNYKVNADELEEKYQAIVEQSKLDTTSAKVANHELRLCQKECRRLTDECFRATSKLESIQSNLAFQEEALAKREVQLLKKENAPIVTLKGQAIIRNMKQEHMSKVMELEQNIQGYVSQINVMTAELTSLCPDQ